MMTPQHPADLARLLQGLADRLLGLRRSRRPLCLDAEEEASLGIGREAEERRCGQLSRAGVVRLVLCPVSLKQGERGKRQRNYQAADKRSRPDSLPPGGRPATGEDVLGVKGSWLGVLALVDLTEPPLRLAEVPAAEDEAPVAVVLVPLDRADLKAGVVTHPVGIGVEGLRERPDGGLEIALIGEEDPVPGPGGFGHLFGRYLAADDRQDSLVEARRVLDLFPADVGDDRVGADHEDEGLCALDRGPHLPHPLRGGRDVVPVDPAAVTQLPQGQVQAANELRVATRVGDEDLAAASGPPIHSLLFDCAQ